MDELDDLKKRLEEAEKRASFLRQIVDVSPTFLFAKDREGRFTFVNQAIAEAYGTTVDELLGKRDADFNLNVEEVQFFRKMDLEVMDRQTPRLIPLEQITDSKGKIRWLQTIKSPLVGADGHANQVLGSATDISSRREVEQQLRESETELRDSQKSLRNLTGRLLTAQEDERRRLAREIHDDLTQRLAVLALQARELGRQLHDSPAAVTERIEEICAGLKGLSEDARHLSHELHPAILEDLGLVDALATECDGFSQRHGVTVMFDAAGVPADLPPDVAICCYRIAQEALHNVAKHAHTREARVAVRGTEGTLQLTIADSGGGFNPTDSHQLTGMGLSSMQERARLVGGQFRIESTPGTGTKVRVRVPLD